MIDNINIIDYIDNLLYIITDSNHNVIYPENQKKIDEFYQVIQNKQLNDCIYDKDSNKLYKYYKKSLDNNKYKLEYLLDVTEIEKSLETKYQNDILTSVLTRYTILQKIDEQLVECINNNYSFSVVIADIDHFKDVNDLYGHLTGDEVLKRIGKILLENTNNENDLIGRYGGEEFLFFFKNINLDDTISKIIKIKSSLDKMNFIFQDKEINNITMSFGVYHINNIKNKNFTKTDMISELINGADIALYKSKQGGRNLTHIYSDEGFIKKVDYK